MTRQYIVKCGYNAHHANIVTVEAGTLEEALEKAVEAANDDGERWRSTDHCSDTFVDAVCEGAGGDPWGEGAIPLPDRYSERGEPPVVTLTGPAPPGGIEIAGGRVPVRFATDGGAGALASRHRRHRLRRSHAPLRHAAADALLMRHDPETPDRQHGEPPIVTLTDPSRPDGGVQVARGAVIIRLVGNAGTVATEVSSRPSPETTPPVVTVRRRADGWPQVTTTEGKARVRVIEHRSCRPPTLPSSNTAHPVLDSKSQGTTSMSPDTESTVLRHLIEIRDNMRHLNNRVSSVERHLANIHAKIANIHTEIATVHSEIATVHTDVANVHHRLDTIERRLEISPA